MKERTSETAQVITAGKIQQQLQGIALAPTIAYSPEDSQHGSPSLKAARSDALQEIEQRLVNLFPVPANIAAKIVALTSANSLHAIRTLKADIQQNIQQVIEAQTLENSITSSLSEKKIQLQQSWQEFEHCEKDIADEFEELYRQGKISREQMEYLHRERTRLDGLPKDDELRIAGEQHLAEYQKELGIHVRDEARQQGDQHAEHVANAVVTNTNTQIKRIEQIHTLSDDIKRQEHSAQETTKQSAALSMLNEDEVSQTPGDAAKDKITLPVSDASHDDIQAPSGAKDRSEAKTIVRK